MQFISRLTGLFESKRERGSVWLTTKRSRSLVDGLACRSLTAACRYLFTSL
jgi:hypothetical protein